MEDEIKKLVEQIFATGDLMTMQSLAVELQRAVYEHIEQLQKKLAESSLVQSDNRPVVELTPSSTLFDDPSQKVDDKSSH